VVVTNMAVAKAICITMKANTVVRNQVMEIMMIPQQTAWLRKVMIGSSHSESSSVAEHHGEHESGEAHSDHHTGSTPKTHVHKDGKEHTHDK
jgi:hypothetical protein